jgi:hypothetical protein
MFVHPVSHRISLAVASLAAAGLASSAAAQFDTVIDLPDMQPSIGGGLLSSTQLNVFDGGTITGTTFLLGLQDGSDNTNIEANFYGGFSQARLFAYSGSTLNIFGGTFQREIRAFEGSVVRISGGSLDKFRGDEGSTAFISGGNFADGIDVEFGSSVEISGGRFGEVDLDGATLVGGEFFLNGQEITEFSGSLRDTNLLTGTLADGSVFVFSEEARDDARDLNLSVVALDPIDTTPIVVDSGEAQSRGLRTGQTMTVTEGGSVGLNFAAVNATLRVEGGAVADRLEAAGASVTVAGGTVGRDFTAFAGTTVEIAGGSVGERYLGASGSSTTVSGGSIGDFAAFENGSTLSMTSGSIGDGATIGFGQNENAIATATLSGGTVGDFLEVGRDARVTVSGAAIGDSVFAYSGSVITMTEGSIGSSLIADIAATINIEGGEIAAGMNLIGMSVANISGGMIGAPAPGDRGGGDLIYGILAGSATTVNVSGGSFVGPISINGDFNLFGTAFFLDGVELTDLVLGSPYELLERESILSGTFADGSSFLFTLNTENFVYGEDNFGESATITLNLVPAPGVAASLMTFGVVASRRRRGSHR